MGERGSVAPSNEVLPTSRFAVAEIPLLKDKAYVCLVVPLYHGQTDCC